VKDWANGPLNQSNDFLEPFSVNFFESVEGTAVDIQDTPDFAFFVKQGNDDLGVGAAVTGDVAGEMMNIRDDDRLTAQDAGPADTLVFFKDWAGQGTLVGPDDELAFAEEVEAGPEKVWHFVVQERRDAGQAGGFILRLEKELFELSVNSGVSLDQACRFVHGQSINRFDSLPI
jgi:hypothetical protein